MDAKNSALTGKQKRIIERAILELFSVKSFRPIKGIDDVRNTPFGNLLELTGNRIVIVTDSGMEQVKTLVGTIQAADIYDGMVDYPDIWSASWKTLQELCSSGQMPSDGDEWVDLVTAKIAPQIQNRTFVVPFIGVELDGIDELPMGSMTLLRPSVEHLDKVGVNHGFAEVPRIISNYRGELWLTGNARGSKRVAAKRFAHLADLAAGMLVVAAACMQPSGATRLFISPNMAGHQNHGDSVWLSWQGERENFSLQTSGLRGVSLPINSDVLEQLTSTSILAGAMPIFESQSRTPLQDAITSGFHWFVDAHRDPTPVMQFVKYWSCIEAFFSGDQKDITRSVSVGLASVLVFGGYQFAPVEDYPVLKKRIAKLYGLRSKAVHRASRTHITENDVAELSHRVAQLLANAISFSERGYKTTEEIKAQCERLERVFEEGCLRRAESSTG